MRLNSVWLTGFMRHHGQLFRVNLKCLCSQLFATSRDQHLFSKA